MGNQFLVKYGFYLLIALSTQACVLGGFVSRSTVAQSSVDSSCSLSIVEEFITHNSSYNISTRAGATFQSPTSATLDSAEFRIRNNGATSVTVEVYEYGGGDVDSGTLLETAVFTDIPSLFEWKKVVFSGSTRLNASSSYAFVMIPTGGNVRWRSDSGGGYAPGLSQSFIAGSWVGATGDLTFIVNECI